MPYNILREKKSKIVRVTARSIWAEMSHMQIKAKGRGESAALGQRMPWANRLFSKSIKGKILNFYMKLRTSIRTSLSKLNRKNWISFLKKKALFSRDERKLFVQSFSLLKLAKLNFYF